MEKLRQPQMLFMPIGSLQIEVGFVNVDFIQKSVDKAAFP